MKKFDNFDESVKNKMDGMNFSFNEANWEKMSQMLDATRPAKKPFGKLPLISSIIVGSAFVVGSVWYMMNNSADTREVAQTTTVASNNEANVNSNNVNASLTSNNVNNNTPSSSNENNVIVTDNSENTNSSITASKEEVSIKNVSKNSVAATSSEKKNKTSKRSTHSVPVNSFASNSNDSKAITNDTENAKETENANSQVPVATIENNHMKDGKDEKAAEQTTAGNEEKNVAIEDAELVSLPSVTTTLGQTAETIAAANLVTSALEEKKAWEYVRVKHHTMSVEGGAINSFGWKVNQTRNGNNISPVLGLNYMYNIDSRHSVLVGLQYNTLANLGEAQANFSVTTYGFGINNDVTNYQLSDLHYAVMPMKYIYRIDKNNALGFGANAMYLVNARTQITNTEFTESNISSNDRHFEFGYGFDQLNRFNAQLAVSYHHSISNKLAINAELNKSLMNVVKDYNYYGAKSQNSAPAAIKLSLTYTLFNK